MKFNENFQQVCSTVVSYLKSGAGARDGAAGAMVQGEGCRV